MEFAKKVGIVAGVAVIGLLSLIVGLATISRIFPEPTGDILEVVAATSTTSSAMSTTLATTTTLPPTTTQPPTTTTRPRPTTAPTLNLTEIEDLYISFLRSWSFDQPYVTVVDIADDQQLLNIGWETCGVFSTGGDARTLYDIAAESFGDDQQSIDDIAVISGAAVALLCPEYADLLGA